MGSAEVCLTEVASASLEGEGSTSQACFGHYGAIDGRLGAAPPSPARVAKETSDH